MRPSHRRLARWPSCLGDEPATDGPRVCLRRLEGAARPPRSANRTPRPSHGVVKLEGLSESKDVLFTPVSGERGSDLRLRGMTSPITMGRQDRRISFTRNHGADDPQTGLAHDVGHHVMELNVHLHQRLLNVLNVRRSVVQQALTLAEVGAQCSHLSLGSEAGRSSPYSCSCLIHWASLTSVLRPGTCLA